MACNSSLQGHQGKIANRYIYHAATHQIQLTEVIALIIFGDTNATCYNMLQHAILNHNNVIFYADNKIL